MLLIQRNAVVTGTAAAMHRLETDTRLCSSRAAIRSSSMSQAGSANSSDRKNWSRMRRARINARTRAPSAAATSAVIGADVANAPGRSEEQTSDLQSLMRISYAVFCLKNKKRILLKKTKNHKANTEN